MAVLQVAPGVRRIPPAAVDPLLRADDDGALSLLDAAVARSAEGSTAAVPGGRA